jgi:hypothetical protein
VEDHVNVFSESDLLILQDENNRWRWEDAVTPGEARQKSERDFATPHQCIDDLVSHGYLMKDVRRST